ncbi:hypothetical protein [Streptomyces sp. NBC_01304]|uniref:hypothetical protein n=1 Tax=Streptomyces sp. NBC_01304 TaxID=2903818 RepID=UPI002E10BE65|nr:hypothetical protein OG430_37080 [Streptomyces sp. NBC_01304]
MRLVLTRDSVAMGDDADAPHEQVIESDGELTLAGFLSDVRTHRYLASIAGGRATWVLYEGAETLAVIAQEWGMPRFLADSRRTFRGQVVRLHFRYEAQQDPDEVYNQLA